jgi:phosphate transport system substrate-binding protein
MKLLLIITYWTAALAQLECGPPGSFTIAGSSTVEPIALAWAKGYTARCPDTNIIVEGGGSSVGAGRVCNLTAAGTAVEIGTMSREWTTAEANQTATPGKYICNIGTQGRIVTQIDVAIDGITIALISGGLAAQCLRKLNGQGLSIDQLRWIYSNYTTTQLIAPGWDATSIPNDDNNETSHKWTEISGKTLCPLIDFEIKLSAPGSLSGTFDFFKTQVLPNATEGVATKRPNGIVQSEIDEELVEFVETSSEEVYGDAIGFFGFSYFINEGQILYGVPIRAKGATVWIKPNLTTVTDGTYVPFSRRIYMNVLDASLEQTGPYISYGLNQEGIGIVKKVGYVPPPRIELAEILARIGRLPPAPTPAPNFPPCRYSSCCFFRCTPIRPSSTPVLLPTFIPTFTDPTIRGRCGLLNLSIFCPRSLCGVVGRILGLCNESF